MKKIKLAIIGCGGICRYAHTPALQQLSEYFDVVATCDIVKERAGHFAEVFGAKAYTDYEELLEKEELDAVDIATPNYLHSIIAVKALNKGLHVICEKPDAVSVEECLKMKNAAEESGKTLMVMRNNRYLPMSPFLKKYIEDGKMGDIYATRCGWIRRRGIPGKGGWFTTKAMSGGGPLIDLGVHMIDLTMWLMGNPRPVAVTGCTYNKFAGEDTKESTASRYGDAKEGGTFDVEDLAIGFIRFENGASMQIEFSWASNIETEYGFVELRGSKAGAKWTNLDHKLKLFSEENGTILDIQPHIQPLKYERHAGMLHNFAEVINGNSEPNFVPEQGLDMIKILCAIYESAETGKEVLL